jgi:hypothetical protein
MVLERVEFKNDLKISEGSNLNGIIGKDLFFRFELDSYQI